jgi:predicted ATP-grasp superfamily ATP-dependent carboligase
MSMDEFVAIFRDEKEFPDFLIMEYVDGEEIDAMTLAIDGEALLVTCKTRETSRGGVIMTGELVERPELVQACRKIIETIPINYNSGMQFKGGYLIEINTRVSTFIYQDDLIEPYLSIKLALGELSKDEVRGYQDRVRYGRRMLRYMDQVFYDREER